MSKTWTKGTLAHTIVGACHWTDPSSATQQLWLVTSTGNIMRWQESATSDAGTAIPNWSYSTGFYVAERNQRGRWLFMDTSGTLTASIYKDTGTSHGASLANVTTGEQEIPFPPLPWGRKFRFVATGANTVQLTRLMVEFEQVEGRGG